MGATAVYALDTERDKDAQAIFERSQKIQEVSEVLVFESLPPSVPMRRCVILFLPAVFLGVAGQRGRQNLPRHQQLSEIHQAQGHHHGERLLRHGQVR